MGSSYNYNKGKNEGYQARSGGDQGQGQSRSDGTTYPNPLETALNALMASQGDQANDTTQGNDSGETHMGSLYLYNAVNTQLPEIKPKKILMYMDLNINGQSTMVMVDTGVTHSLIIIQEVNRLGLRLVKDSSRMKAVNSAVIPIHGVTKSVLVKMGQWSGKVNHLAVTLDNFKNILGMNFLRYHKVVPMPIKHVPGFINHAEELKSKGIDEILLIGVNDPYVMKAWAKTYPDNKNVKFLANGSANYMHALGLELDLGKGGLGTRSWRFTLLVDDLKVKAANIELRGEFTVTSAEDIIKAL
ncbi:hypothetical protein GIB67_023174 [Kingdonia uniflora]|uniref:Glutaredoxin-dependent peroxiredoxin n=1 Tax=Kingdonia uniflora TaxID=39325 RepID=A0A7J7MCH1_9MAGN|nr:hypothetical protein GIB67_023174 [Kingdonia uniflora]